jgi:hypothetical protein
MGCAKLFALASWLGGFCHNKLRSDGSRCSPESDFLQVEGILYDSRGGHPHSQDVLLRWKVAGLCYSGNIAEITERKEGIDKMISQLVSSVTAYYLAESVS